MALITLEEINKCIGKAFTSFGYTVEISRKAFVFEPLSLKISGEIDDLGEHNNDIFSARLIIKLEHKEFLEPINEFVYGWGESTEIAIVNAFERWLESDFPVIHDLLADHKISEDSTVEMQIASHSGVTNEQISWRGVLGPFLSSANSEITIEDDIRYEIIRVLFHDITGEFLSDRGIYPIKCFLSKNKEGEIQIDCRLNGSLWEIGWNTLYRYCQDWEVSKYLFWKQYFVLSSVEKPHSEELTKILEKERRKLNEK